jgi:molybdate transport system substrate-binding protein
MHPAWRSVARHAVAIAALATAAQAKAGDIDVYAAGSLKLLITDLHERAAAMGINVHATFGGSGALREQIERGARPDLLLSADLASPAALAATGRAILPPVAFARNRICLVARRSLSLTPTNLIPKLLENGVRIKTSEPKADPSGDYAMAMFDLMGRAEPGAGQTLRVKASKFWHVTAPTTPAGQNASTALFDANLIDVAVTYCSGSDEIARSAKDLVSLPVPKPFEPHPVFGAALLSDKPDAARFALLLLSQDGQAEVARAGLIPLMDPPPSTTLADGDTPR